MFDRKILSANVIVSALGYFVDIYDLLLFGIVRVSSLKSLGFEDQELLDKGVILINSQMAGMLVGGVIWGVLGDKKGRLSVLFGSIALYSFANIANAFVGHFGEQAFLAYGILRFVAGVGLAGELGAAITLVSETLSKEQRGYGTTIVASVGILGAVVAALVGDYFSWTTAYLIGGGMGLLLLALRVTMFESGLFHQVKSLQVRKGDLRMLLFPWTRFLKYSRCILIGVPVWFVVGILVTFSPELARALGVQDAISAGSAIMWCYLGLAIGDFVSGFLSQFYKTRRKVVAAFLLLTLALTLVYVFGSLTTSLEFYALCVALGFGSGYWAVFATIAAEQFGTNLRATVTTTVPNFVRGSVVPLTLSFQFIKNQWGVQEGILAVGLLSFAIAFWSLYLMQETFGKDLDYVELKIP